MSATEKFFDKPLPSLKAWIGDGTRAEGFEEWVKEAIALGTTSPDPRDQAATRIMLTLSIAFVEAGRIELEQHGNDWATTVPMLARAAGAIALMAVMNGIEWETKPRDIMRLGKLIADECAKGAMMVARGVARKTR